MLTIVVKKIIIPHLTFKLEPVQTKEYSVKGEAESLKAKTLQSLN